VLIDIFIRIKNFFTRLEFYTKERPSIAMANMIVDVMTEVLSVLAIATKDIKQCRSSEFIDDHKLLFD
jgi:hypothetical protein